jgi:hypothetical protein
VEFIRAGLDGGADDGCRRTPELGAETFVLTLNSSTASTDGVGNAVASDAVEQAGVIIDAIEQTSFSTGRRPPRKAC